MLLNMKVSLCCCGRLENRYAIEFIEYYKKLGFDHIYIIDNNHDNEEHFEDVIQKYINENFVTIYNFRNKECVQIYSYIEVYNKIKDNYDWVFFCDFDEFLTLENDNNIKEYLSRDRFKKYNQILINWVLYNDNNLIYDDGRSCLERFTTKSNYTGQKIGLVKPIIRTTIENIYIQNTIHQFRDNKSILEKSTCNNFGKPITLHDCGAYDIYDMGYNLAYIKHFTTKTIDEYTNKKLKVGTGDRVHSNKNLKYYFDNFFEINEITKEKINYLNEHNIKYDLKQIN